MLYQGGPNFFCVEENKEYKQKSTCRVRIIEKKKSFMINYFLQLQ